MGWGTFAVSWLQGSRSPALAGREGGGYAPLSHAGLGICGRGCTLGSLSQPGGWGLGPQKEASAAGQDLGMERVLVRVLE